jgi:hypothetical protein
MEGTFQASAEQGGFQQLPQTHQSSWLGTGPLSTHLSVAPSNSHLLTLTTTPRPLCVVFICFEALILLPTKPSQGRWRASGQQGQKG